MPVKRPYISYVSLNSGVATVSLGNYISDFSYTEEPGFGRSHCEFTLEPKGSYIPKIGDSIEIQVKYQGDPSGSYITTGTHIVNDITFDHTKKLFNVGMSAYTYNGGAYSQAGYSYDTRSIRQIVDTQASALGLTVDNLTGISTAIAGFWFNNNGAYVYRFKANTRAEILETLAKQYGFLLRVKAGKIFFYDLLGFETATPTIYLSPVDMAGDSFVQSKESTNNVYSAVRVWYATSTPLTANPPSIVSDLAIDDSSVINRILNLVDNGLLYDNASAIRYAYGAARESNKEQQVFTATTEGDYRFVLGAVCQLYGFDEMVGDGVTRFNRNYYLRKCVHSLRPGDSWRTMIELQRIFLL